MFLNNDRPQCFLTLTDLLKMLKYVMIPQGPHAETKHPLLTTKPLEFPSLHLWHAQKGLARDQPGSCMLFPSATKLHFSFYILIFRLYAHPPPSARTSSWFIRNKPYHVNISPLPQTKDCLHLLPSCPNKNYHRLNSRHLQMSKGESVRLRNWRNCIEENNPPCNGVVLHCLYRYNINTPLPIY